MIVHSTLISDLYSAIDDETSDNLRLSLATRSMVLYTYVYTVIKNIKYLYYYYYYYYYYLKYDYFHT